MFFNIVKKEVLQNLRDKKAMFWMILFPIIMIFILGNALSSFFGKEDLEIPKTNISYTIDKKSEDTDKLEDFFNDSKEELNINFTKEDNEKEAIENIKRGKLDCYLDIKDGENIIVYSNKIKDFNASLVTNLLDIYMERNNAYKSIKENNPIGLQFVDFNSTPNYVKIKSLNKAAKPTAKDYYSVTMLTMIVLYGSLTGAMTIIGERARGTMTRVVCSPVNRLKLFLGKLTGAFIVVTLQIAVLFLFTKYIFKANWGDNLTPIILIILSLIFMTISLGMGLARIFRNPNVSSTVANVVIVLLNFLGGAYIPLETFGQNNILLLIANVSPLKWTNNAILRIIYGGNVETVNTAIVINIIVALVFLIIPYLIRRGEEV